MRNSVFFANIIRNNMREKMSGTYTILRMEEMRYAENLVGKPEGRSFYFSDMKFILQR
jgi:hypothetical protein